MFCFLSADVEPRDVSGTAFVGDLLSEEVFTPNTSSTELAPQVAPHQGDEEVTRRKHEQEASTSSREKEEEEEEEVEVSCTDIISTIIGEDAQRIASSYDLEVVMPYELERLHRPPTSYITVSEAYLKFRVRFPLHTFFVEVLKHFGLTMFRVTPNGWAHMIGLFGLFVERRMGPPTEAEFVWFYSIKANKNYKRFYYFAKRPTKGLQAITKIKERLGN